MRISSCREWTSVQSNSNSLISALAVFALVALIFLIMNSQRAQAQTPSTAAAPGTSLSIVQQSGADLREGRIDQQIQNRVNRCSEAVNRVRDSRSKALAACSKNFTAGARIVDDDDEEAPEDRARPSISKATRDAAFSILGVTSMGAADSAGWNESLVQCIGTAKRCSEVSTSRELPSNPATMMTGLGPEASMALHLGQLFGGGDTGDVIQNSCPARSMEDWARSDTDLRNERNRFQKDALQLRERATTERQRSEDEARKITERATELEDRLQSAMQEAQAANLKTEAQVFERMQEARAKIGEINRNLRVANVKLAAMINQRAAYLNAITEATFQANCLARIQKVVKDFGPASSRGGFSGASRSSTTKNQVVKTSWESCLAEARAARDKNLDDFSSGIVMQEEAIKAMNEQLVAVQEGIDGLQKTIEQQKGLQEQAQLAMRERAIRDQRKLGEDLARLGRAVAERQQLAGQEQALLMGQLNEVSNRMVQLGPRPRSGGKETPQEAVSAVSSFVSDLRDACAQCQDVPVSGSRPTDQAAVTRAETELLRARDRFASVNSRDVAAVELARSEVEWAQQALDQARRPASSPSDNVALSNNELSSMRERLKCPPPRPIQATGSTPSAR